MTTKFRNPPLLELIAELRWDFMPGQPVSLPGVPMQIQIAPGIDDGYFTRFREACETELGFNYTERLLPPGQPPIPGQPLLRLSRSGRDMIVQIGLGVVLIHALPPYRSWSTFSPQVDNVVSAILKTLDIPQEFLTASVRYLDAYGSRFLGSMTPADFAQNILGYRLDLPEAVASERDTQQPTQFALNYSFSTQDGMQAQLSIAEGVIDNETALITDTTVRASSPVPATNVNVMDLFGRAHDVIHNIFIDSTTSIQDQMEVVEDAND